MKILFVCTGNTCRSSMAEGILKYISERQDLGLEVASAGISVFDGDMASNNAIEAMKKINIDITDHEARQLHIDMIEESDLILTMSGAHKEFIRANFPSSTKKVYSLMEYAFKVDKDVVDPFGGKLSVYEHTRDDIYQAIRQVVGRLANNE